MGLRWAVEGCDGFRHISCETAGDGSMAHGGRGRDRGRTELGGWWSALVGSTLDALFADLPCGVDTGVGQAVFDASGAGSSFVALFASLLAVDTSILDLSPFGLLSLSQGRSAQLLVLLCRRTRHRAVRSRMVRMVGTGLGRAECRRSQELMVLGIMSIRQGWDQGRIRLLLVLTHRRGGCRVELGVRTIPAAAAASAAVAVVMLRVMARLLTL